MYYYDTLCIIRIHVHCIFMYYDVLPVDNVYVDNHHYSAGAKESTVRGTQAFPATYYTGA